MEIQYDELDPSQRQIRLLRYLRTNKEHPDFSIETISLDDRREYACLSYVWGNPDRVSPIIVNGAVVNVTQNLGDALRRLEDEDDVVCLWADAICINQESKDEKASQVGMMGQIYSLAKAVMAWLGPEADGSGYVMDAIGRTGAIIWDELLRTPVPRAREDDALNALIAGLYQLQMLTLEWIGNIQQPAEFGRKVALAWEGEPLPSSGTASRATAFFSRPYWTRAWILQELELAKSVFLLVGAKRQPFFYLKAFWEFFFSFKDLPLNDSHPMRPLRMQLVRDWRDATILLCFRTRARLQSPDLFTMLEYGLFLQATIPQDVIFSMLSLVSERSRRHVRIDYDIPFAKIFEDVAKEHFLSQQNIDIRQIAPEKFALYSRCPSWAASPLGDAWPTNTLDSFPIFIEPQLRFSSSRGFETPLAHSNFPRPGILSLPCWLVGEVEACQPLEVSHQSFHALDHAFWGDIGIDLPDDIIQFVEAGRTLQKIARFLRADKPSELWDKRDNKTGNSLWWLPFCEGQRDRQSDDSSGLAEARRILFLMEVLTEMDNLHKLKEEILEQGSSFQLGKGYKHCALRLKLTLQGRSVFKTSTGYKGLGPEGLKAGDQVVIIPTVGVPWIARPTGENRYKLVGDAYVLGIMYGEFCDNERTLLEFC